MIGERCRLARTPAHDVAVDCIEAARPVRAMRGVFERGEGKLRIDGSTLDLDEYTDDRRRRGKAVAGMAGML